MLSPLVVCIFVTLVAMNFISGPPYAGLPLWRMTVAMFFIVLVWVLFVIGGAPLKL
jgi:hypothetical protein